MKSSPTRQAGRRFPEQIKLADASPVIVRTYPEQGFEITADPFLDAITPVTRGIVINSPCNPTGAMIAEHELSRIIDAVADTNIWIVLDLCYEQLIYDPVPHNLPNLLAARMRDRPY